MPQKVMLCPECKRDIPHIQDWPQESRVEGSQFVVSLASGVYECPDHGYFRIYISGAAVPVTKNKS